MKLVRTPNKWSCLAASFATVLGLTFDEIVDRLGHDGSETVFPEYRDPERRRAFHPQEMIDIAEALGFSVTPIEARPSARVKQGGKRVYEVPLDIFPRFQRYLESSSGVLTGLNLQNRPHAVVWDGRDCHDPSTGERYGIHLFQPQTFWRVTTQGSPIFNHIEGSKKVD